MRIALFGHGHMGRLHLRHLGEHEVVVVDPEQGHAPDIGAIDAAIVATPTATHLAVARPLLDRGVPCLVEKPLAATVEDAAALAVYPHLSVGHIERYNPAMPTFDDVRFVQAERVGRFTPRGTDVDVVLDLMIHDLDLFLHLVDEPIAEVRANGVAIATGGYDVAQARVATVSGRVGTFTSSRLARQPSRRWRVFDGASYWSIDLKERQVVRVEWGGELRETVVPVPTVDALGAEIAAFLAAVRGERPYPVPGADALRAIELAAWVRAEIGGR